MGRRNINEILKVSVYLDYYKIKIIALDIR